MSLDLQSLENFVLVASHGSFSRAATIAGVGQPALGRQIRKLETECGCALFYRHGRGVQLTAEGEIYLARIRPLIKQLTAGSLDLRSTARDIAGPVVLGITPTFQELIGMRLLATARRLQPKIRLNVVSGYSGYIHEWLIADRLDIAILHDAKRSSHINFEPLAHADLYLVSSPATLSRAQRGAKTVEFPRLGDYSLALPTRHHGLRKTIDLAASDSRLSLRVEYEVDTLPLMKLLAINELAHTVLALPAVASEVQDGRLVARQIVNPALTTALGLATATNRPITRATQFVVSLVRTELEAAINRSRFDLGLTIAGSPPSRRR